MLGFGKKDDESDKQIAQSLDGLAQRLATVEQNLNKRAGTITQLQGQIKDLTEDVAGAAKAQQQVQAVSQKLGQLQASLQQARAKKQAQAAAQPAAAAPAATTPAKPGLQVGVTAWVQKAGGKNLRLRDAAGLNSNAFDGLAPGTQLTLLEGPQSLDGYTWWRIRASDGREGWVAGEELVTTPE